MHVTLIYSRTPVDWMKTGNAWEEEIKLPPGGARLMDQFGEATVLLFNSSALKWRHEDLLRAGAKSDYSEFNPHITISWEPAPDLATVEPWQGKIVLGPEIYSEVKEDWQASLVEDDLNAD